MIVLFAYLCAVFSCRLVAELVDAVVTAFFAVLEWFTDWLFRRRDLNASGHAPARPAERFFAHGTLQITVICLFGNLVALHELFSLHRPILLFAAPLVTFLVLVDFLIILALLIYASTWVATWFSSGLRKWRSR
ncbi:MAG: hypothetical protein KGS72_26010 [Cyanobacteria bacterium REEB67]|nr:hypothetical protein [Cyanobacteria bacterium REEB67]